MQSDFTVVLVFFWPIRFFVHNSSWEKKKNYTCLVFLPRWAHKIPLTFTNVSRVGFHVCNMLSAKNEAKGQMRGNFVLFCGENIPFNAKSAFHSNKEKNHTSQQHQKGIMQREILNYLLLWHSAALRPWLASLPWV